MKRIFSLVFLLAGFAFFLGTSSAQKTEVARAADSAMYVITDKGCFAVYPEHDPEFLELRDSIDKRHIPALPIGERIAAMGKLLLDRPYFDRTLETTTDEGETVCNLLGFDCVTFFETSWALATTFKKYPMPGIPQLKGELENHRYRDGKRNGYQSRLHYTSDYFYDNARRGNLKEMTKSIGGKDAILEKKQVNFMTKHAKLYKQLRNDSVMVQKMDSIEKILASRGGFYYIPKEDVEDIEKGIRTGDLIGITTSIPGIDCSHTGIAIREKDGKVHFMHASSTSQKVIISPMTLAEYLEGNAKQTGIMIYRPVEVK